MINKVKISVAVITYNQQDTIRQTLDSILMQKGDFDLELVIGEDCSTDATHSICEEYVSKSQITNHKSQIILLPNTHNLGIMANFARTMRACTGDYIGILAGDDYWCDDRKLEKQLNFMIANPQFGVCCTSGYRLMVETGRLVPGIAPLNPILDGDVSKFYKNNISGIYAQPLSLLIRSDMMQYLDFDEYIRRKFPFEDYPMQSVLAHHTLFGYLPDRTSVYRIDNRSATFTSFDSDKFMAYYAGIADMRRYLHGLFPEDVPFSEQWATEYVGYWQFLQYAWHWEYQQAKNLAETIDKSSSVGRKMRRLTVNIFVFYAFALCKRLKYKSNIKKRTN